MSCVRACGEAGRETSIGPEGGGDLCGAPGGCFPDAVGCGARTVRTQVKKCREQAVFRGSESGKLGGAKGTVRLSTLLSNAEAEAQREGFAQVTELGLLTPFPPGHAASLQANGRERENRSEDRLWCF